MGEQLQRVLYHYGRWLIIGLPLLWLMLFFMLPLLEMAQVSFTEARRGIPPFKPLWGFGEDGFFTNFTLGNYQLIYDFYEDYLGPALNSLRIAFFSTLFCLLFAYPMAYWIARSPDDRRHILLILVLLPFWTSSLLRMYALIGLLNPNGFVNGLLLWAGIIDTPIAMMQTDLSVYLGMLLTYLPLMILPLYATLTRLDQSLHEAASDLGASSFTIFFTITIPLSLSGIIAGCLLVFIPAVGEFVIPALLGGPDQVMLGKVLWTEFFRNRDWPVAAAIALILMVIVTGPIIYMRYIDRGDEEEGGTRMIRAVPRLFIGLGVIGFALLYIPALVMMAFSFNAGKLASVWAGFSFKWYGALLQNDQLLAALSKSLLIAGVAASLSTLFGILIAVAFVRFGRFRSRLLLSALASAPLVIPEVVMGLSLLLLFIAMENLLGWPAGRGLDTIIIAHATFGMCFAAVVIQARLRQFDRALEEAAMDLGARQPYIFLTITLPIIAPAIISAWLLTFTLSFDDLVIASFVSGPGSSTLPIVIFSKVRLGVTPEINAIATLMIVIIAIGVIAGARLMRRKSP